MGIGDLVVVRVVCAVDISVVKEDVANVVFVDAVVEKTTRQTKLPIVFKHSA